MLAHEQAGPVPQPRWRPAPFHLLSTASNVLTADEMRARLEAEALRHARYLQGYGVVRVSSPGEVGRSALEEAVATETRCTDAVCAVGDGSFAVLVVNGDVRTLEVVADRLIAVARELAEMEGDDAPVFQAGCAAAGNRRLSAEEVWRHAGEAMRIARDAGGGVHLYEGH